jgi:hypothetical protein
VANVGQSLQVSPFLVDLIELAAQSVQVAVKLIQLVYQRLGNGDGLGLYLLLDGFHQVPELEDAGKERWSDFGGHGRLL